jgi:hypothetical protein
MFCGVLLNMFFGSLAPPGPSELYKLFLLDTQRFGRADRRH